MIKIFPLGLRFTAFLFCFAFIQPFARATISGQWDFQSGDLSAKIGQPLEYFDGANGETSQLTVFGKASELGLPLPAGQDVHVMGFPRSLPTMGFVMRPGMTANGGGFFVNQYTLIFDILFPAASSTSWRALVQIDDHLANANDADLFINAAGAVGIAGQYQGAVLPDTWHRLAFAVDLANLEGPLLSKYIDGTLVGQQILPEGLDARWALNAAGDAFGDQILLFTDNNADGGHVQPGFVSSIQVHDQALSTAYLAALGKVNADSIPTGISVPAAIVAHRPAEQAVNVLPNSTVEVEIGLGSGTINPSTVVLQINGENLVTTWEQVESILKVKAVLPELPSHSENQARIEFNDPVGGSLELEWSFRMAPFGDHPEIAAGLSKDLLALWKLDEGLTDPSGTTVSDLISGSNGSLNATNVPEAWKRDADARFGGALAVDGLNTFVSIPSSPTLNIDSDQLTLSLWVQLDQLPSTMAEGFGGIYDSTQDAYVLYMDRGARELRFKTTTASGQAARPGIPENQLVIGEWLHVVAVYDGQANQGSAGEARIYLNGALMDRHVGNDGSGGTGLTGKVRTGQEASLGRDGTQARYFLSSKIDDIGLWKRALSETEIGYLSVGKEVPDSIGATDPLVIVDHPMSHEAVEGATVQFLVTISGGRPPIGYQWRFNGGNIDGETQSALTLAAELDRAGEYTVVVSDASGSVESQTAVLKVNPLQIDPALSLAQGLVALWAMDEGQSDPTSTDLTDPQSGISATFNSTNPSGSWLPIADSKLGGALKLNGVDEFVSIPTGGALDIQSDQLTLAAWIQLDHLPSAHSEGFGGIYDSVQDAYVLYYDRGNAELRFKVTVLNGNAARPGIAETQLMTGQWIHVAGVYDGRATDTAGEARIYLNGQVMDTHPGNDGSGGSGLTGFVRTGQAAAIGRNGVESRYWLGFAIDDLAIWNRTLTDTELGYLAGGNPVPKPATVEELRITGIGLNQGRVQINWTGGRAPYQMQKRLNVNEGPWLDVGNPVDVQSVEVELDGDQAFFRILESRP